ncbi:MAG TPA: hypothetical protein VJK51_05400 [Candidatus Nanoarchaeia archaeon]|nr:hypothetical protein [Candidatus Nanoarchaeia archaeon]
MTLYITKGALEQAEFNFKDPDEPFKRTDEYQLALERTTKTSYTPIYAQDINGRMYEEDTLARFLNKNNINALDDLITCLTHPSSETRKKKKDKVISFK